MAKVIPLISEKKDRAPEQLCMTICASSVIEDKCRMQVSFELWPFESEADVWRWLADFHPPQDIQYVAYPPTVLTASDVRELQLKTIDPWSFLGRPQFIAHDLRSMIKKRGKHTTKIPYSP